MAGTISETFSHPPPGKCSQQQRAVASVWFFNRGDRAEETFGIKEVVPLFSGQELDVNEQPPYCESTPGPVLWNS